MSTKQTSTNEIAKVISIGGSLDIEIIASLTETQLIEINLDLNNISSLKDLQPYLTSPPSQTPSNNQTVPPLFPYITLHTTNFLINSLLFINKSNKTKSFVNYIVPFTCAYPDDQQFLKEFVQNITEKNFLFIEEFNLLDITPNITFTIKTINPENDEIINSKHFIISNTNAYDKDNNNYSGDLYSGINYEYDCSYLYSTVNDLYKCKLNSYDEIHSFISHVCDMYPRTIICINYEGYLSSGSEVDVDLVNSIGDLLGLTDVFIFEKKEVNDYFTLLKSINENETTANRTYKSTYSKKSNYTTKSSNNHKINIEDIFIKEIPNNKKNKNVKIGLFIDNMKSISIIQQDPSSMLLMFLSKFQINYIPSYIKEKDKDEYNEISINNYSVIKSVFIGGFLSRMFNKKSFYACYTAGNESVKRVIDLLRFNLDFPNESNYYIITIKKPKQQNKEQLNNIKRENHFVLDCTNINASKKKEYNSLYDHSCQSYFANYNTRHHLYRLGFINKQGIILQDPDRKFFGNVRNKALMSQYEQEKNELMIIKENNMIMNLQLKNFAKNKEGGYKDKNRDELKEMNTVYNYEKVAGRKLPMISKKKGVNKQKVATDLYFQEIKNSKFLTKSQFYKKGNEKGKGMRKSVSCSNVNQDNEYIYYEKESVDSNKMEENEKDTKNDKGKINEKYVNRESFLDMLNSYEEKLRGESMRVTKNGFKY